MTWTSARCGAVSDSGPCVLPADHSGEHAGVLVDAPRLTEPDPTARAALGSGFRRRRPLATLAAFALAGVALIDLQGMITRLAESSSDTVRASVGMGLWLVVGASAVAVLALIASTVQRADP